MVLSFEFLRSPSVTVISPNGGERLKEGNTYIISWKIEDIDDEKINYLIHYYPGVRKDLISNDAKDGYKDPSIIALGELENSITSIEWKIPEYTNQKWFDIKGYGGKQNLGNKYKIHIEAYTSDGIKIGSDTSDGAFTIVCSACAPNGN
jgi:hypothetical protein